MLKILDITMWEMLLNDSILKDCKNQQVFHQNTLKCSISYSAESIFNIIQHSNKILFKFEKSNILDLYAGTGSFGLECLSRQATNVYFIEKREDVIEILNRNIEKLTQKSLLNYKEVDQKLISRGKI